jgi:hypothetical protein
VVILVLWDFRIGAARLRRGAFCIGVVVSVRGLVVLVILGRIMRRRRMGVLAPPLRGRVFPFSGEGRELGVRV